MQLRLESRKCGVTCGRRLTYKQQHTGTPEGFISKRVAAAQRANDASPGHSERARGRALRLGRRAPRHTRLPRLAVLQSGVAPLKHKHRATAQPCLPKRPLSVAQLCRRESRAVEQHVPLDEHLEGRDPEQLDAHKLKQLLDRPVALKGHFDGLARGHAHVQPARTLGETRAPVQPAQRLEGRRRGHLVG